MKNSISTLKILMLTIGMFLIQSCSSNSAKTAATENGATTEAAISPDKKMPFERGSYVMLVKVAGFENKFTHYFDRWGEWTAKVDKSETTIMGMTTKNNKIEIVKGKKHWDLDLDDKSGTTFTEKEISKEAALALAAAMASQVKDDVVITDLGTEEYLGYKCKKTKATYTQNNMEIISLNLGNLLLKSETRMGNSISTSEVLSISKDAPPASIFEIPAGIDIQNLDEE